MLLAEWHLTFNGLRGLGSKTQAKLKKLGVSSIKDLLLYFPRNYLDRTVIEPLSQAIQKKPVSSLVRVVAHDFVGKSYQKILKITLEDRTAQAFLVCFNRPFLQEQLKLGHYFLITASFMEKFGQLQATQFEWEEVDPSAPVYEKVLPLYALTEGINHNQLRRFIREAFTLLGGLKEELSEELPFALREKHQFPGELAALRAIHFPESFESLQKARSYWIYKELFYLQLTLKRYKLKQAVIKKTPRTLTFNLKKSCLERLPFTLTEDQNKVLTEIEADLQATIPMARLLQGDVGCGKTLIAFLAALSVIEAGEQVALLAPTELLAGQHAEKAALFLQPLGVRLALLTGALKAEQRKLLLASLEEGKIDLLIGTHALFTDNVNYHALGLVIIDEQQRFGVAQRLKLLEKGTRPDLLLMSATPIPRSLALTAFGELDISTIYQKPQGRQPIKTHLTVQGNEAKVYNRVRLLLQAGQQAYFVYPLIEESDKLDLKHAEGMYEKLRTAVFPAFRVALIHSRISEEEKRQQMEGFVRGEIQVLVATSVVEVGMDVPNATCMVIEHAERFGLAALHQLRGRVGRGPLLSYAFLIYSEKLTEEGIRRLKIMMETTDGFRIAEEDLKIRGPGELLGLKQAGRFKLTLADIAQDTEWLFKARDDVLHLLRDDPGLLKPDNAVIRELLTKAPPFAEALLEAP
jgi:ATP-dependent DNA helicase RecG